MMNKRWMSLFLSVLVCTGCTAAPPISSGDAPPFDVNAPFSQSEELVLPALYGEGMVLQRGRVKITGKTQDTDIAVILNEKVYWGRCENGSFCIEIPDAVSGGPYSLTVRTRNFGKRFEQVYIGDVFLLGGQSNMSLTLGSCDQTLPVKYINENIHFFTVDKQFADTPQTEVSGAWKKGNAAANMDFSAIGVIFADAMQKKENVPVGAVCASLGGTMTSTWLPEQEAGGIEDIPYINPEKYANTSEPSKCYNGMIAPLTDYVFKGVLWYQGENQTEKHQELLTGVINGWRRVFDDASLPFLIIELPGYEVSEEPTRCALVGRNAFYGENLYTGPVITNCTRENDAIVLSVASEGGLTVRGTLEGCFEIRTKGATKGFVPARAVIEGDTIVVSGIEDPVQVRYCFTSFPRPAIFDGCGLPLDQYVSPVLG